MCEAHRLLFHFHFLAIYVDDLLALFPRSCAHLMSCLCIFWASALELPLSWCKLQLADSLRWIGWEISLGGAKVAKLPCDKPERLLAELQPLCLRRAKLKRAELQKLIGHLCWLSAGLEWLKPWLRGPFHMVTKPHLHFKSLDEGQLLEAKRLLALT